MTQQKDNFLVKGLGIAIQWFTQSNAATPLILFLAVVGFFSAWMQIQWLFIICALGILGLIGFAFLFADHKLRDSRYNLQVRKMERLGDKDNQNVTEAEVVQPVLTPPSPALQKPKRLRVVPVEKGVRP